MSDEFEVDDDVNTKSMSYQWPLLVYYALCLIITPVYFLILICIVKIRRHIVMFRTTFYSLLIQHVSLSVEISTLSMLLYHCFIIIEKDFRALAIFLQWYFTALKNCHMFWFQTFYSNTNIFELEQVTFK